MKEVIDISARNAIERLAKQIGRHEILDIKWASIQHKINDANIKMFCLLIVACLASIAISTSALVVALAK